MARYQDAKLLVDHDVRGSDAVVDALRVVACHHAKTGEVAEVQLVLSGQGVDGVDVVVLSLIPQRRAGYASAECCRGEPLVSVVGVERDRACSLPCGLVDRERREERPKDVAVRYVERYRLVELRGRVGGAVDDEYRHAYPATVKEALV